MSPDMSPAPDPYQPMAELADLFDRAGAELRNRAALGRDSFADPAVAATAEVSPATYAAAERALTEAARSTLDLAVELDADTTMLRATVLTYHWIEGLQQAAGRTMGDLARRAVGFLAPEVELGGTIVSAGLIETEASDRDQVARYLSDLAVEHPELLGHVTDLGLLEGLPTRALLTRGMPTGPELELAARGGRAAVGVAEFPIDAAAVLRDAAGDLVAPTDPSLPAAAAGIARPPAGIADLFDRLDQADDGLLVQQVPTGRWIVFLGSPPVPSRGGLRLVAGDRSSGARAAIRAIEEALSGQDAEQPTHLMLVGSGAAGGVAAEVAAEPADSFVVDQVVALCSPASLVPGIREPSRLLCLEDRNDPVSALGSLVNAEVDHRVVALFETGDAAAPTHLVAGRTVDRSQDPRLRAELHRLREQGYLDPSRP